MSSEAYLASPYYHLTYYDSERRLESPKNMECYCNMGPTVGNLWDWRPKFRMFQVFILLMAPLLLVFVQKVHKRAMSRLLSMPTALRLNLPCRFFADIAVVAI